MPSDAKKKPYASPSLVPLDAREAKAKLLKGNPKDAVVLKMLSIIDRQLKENEVSPARSPNKDIPEK